MSAKKATSASGPAQPSSAATGGRAGRTGAPTATSRVGRPGAAATRTATAASKTGASKKGPGKTGASKETGASKTAARTTPVKPGAASKAVATKATASRTPAKAAAGKTTATRTATKGGAGGASAKASASKSASKTAASKTAAGKTAAGKAAASKTPAAASKTPAAAKRPPTKAGSRGTATRPTMRDDIPKPATEAEMQRLSRALKVKEDEAPWTAAELRAIGRFLREEITSYRSEIEQAEQELVELIHTAGDGAGDDQADAGARTFEREHEIALANNSRDMLQQTERALDRLLAGTYGICENCGNPVGKGRLQVFPRATLCMTCKMKQERH